MGIKEKEGVKLISKNVDEAMRKGFKLLAKQHGERFLKAFDVFGFEVKSFSITRDPLALSGEVKSLSSEEKFYGCYIDSKKFVCGCLDNFIRRKICKHIIALVLKAYHEKEINWTTVLSLLLWRM